MSRDPESFRIFDVFLASDQELKDYVRELREHRAQQQSVVFSLSESNALIALAVAEISSRSSAKLARTAIWISVASVMVAVGLGIVQLVHL